MTVSWYFAARAMQGLVHLEKNAAWEEIAQAAYKQADAMLRVRKNAK